MFFENLHDIEAIASKNGTSIFVVPDEAKVEIKNALVLKPEEKTVITIDQVRRVLETLNTRQLTDRFVLIRPADKLGEEAENAILKNLEEPKEKVHFVLITDNPSRLLPTILSRAALYVWRGTQTSLAEVKADEKTKTLAKKLLAAKPAELVSLAEEIAKKRERAEVLAVLGTAVEMAYKSYFLTGKSAFLVKIPKFTAAYDSIAANGHIKLHLVADLV